MWSHSLSSLKPENNLGKCHVSCYEFGGSCLLSTTFELLSILILHNSKPSMVPHIDVLDSWEVNRNRALDLFSPRDSEGLKLFCLKFWKPVFIVLFKICNEGFWTISQFQFKLFCKAGNSFSVLYSRDASRHVVTVACSHFCLLQSL